MTGAAEPTLAVPVRARRRAWRVPDRLQGPLAVVVLLALLELATAVGVLPEREFPLITDDLRALVNQFGDAGFWTSVGQTLEAWAIGFGLATAFGIVLGALIGSSVALYSATRVIVEFLRPIPSVALVPLAVLVYGTGLESAVFLATFAATWPVLIQAIYGVRDVDPVAVDTARSFGFGRLARLRSVTLPSAVPYIVTGLRIASATALILVVTAELVIGSPGLGESINVARSGGAYDLMYALIIATGLLGWFLNTFFSLLERRLLRWHPSQRAREEGT